MRDLGAEVEERNFAKAPLTRAEVTRIVDAAGGVAAVLNTRHKVAKENGWKEKAPSKAAFVKAVMEEPNLLRRPILLADGRAVVGFDAEAMDALLA